MIPSPDPSAWRVWRSASFIAGGAHVLAVGTLFVHFLWVEPNTDTPAIAVEMASPAALPAPVLDVPTPHQIEAPKQVVREILPKKLPFDPPPPMPVPDVKPAVVLPPKKEETPRKETTSPLPPAPATTQLAAPDLKPDAKTVALLSNGATAGKASPVDLWNARICGRIELTKRYPGVARSDQQDGVDVVLTIDRAGRLLDARIRHSRGFASLDAAALDSVRRAAPFPKPPKEVEGDPIRLSVIVDYWMRRS